MKRASPFAALVVFAASPSLAQPTIVVHDLDTPVECNSYASWWGWYVVTECENHFATMRAGIESALFESGAFQVADRFGPAAETAQFDVFGTVTGLGTEYGRATAPGFCISKTDVRASIDIRIVDRTSGKLVYGGNLQKGVRQASHIKAGTDEDCSAERRQPFYEIVQRELSLAVARAVAFRIQPVSVQAVEGRKIVLDRGKPLVSLGAMLKVADASGYPQRYRVTATMGDRAFAEPMGRPANILAGTAAEFVESDDDEANARRFEKTDLP